ncbi:MAG: DUF2520 domain-containing protein [Chitinispirillales bacterium]|jgi:predicted short-subunit dehydrogenase-like oxidoreductase (DUF2520 family)|nr:DUF2520 domain-containing protein [Chitinispirillales bacterium]
MAKRPDSKMSVIGCGKAGKTLASLFYNRGVFDIDLIVNTTIESGQEAVEFIGAGRAGVDFADVCQSSVIMIGVPDDEIYSCALKLARCGNVKSGAVVFHCSGFHASSVLEPLAKRGCLTASVHPVRSFSDPKAALQNFGKTPCALEGGKEALTFLKRAVSSIGGDIFIIDAEKKPLYHSAAVFLNNYVVALMHASFSLLAKSGLNEEQSKNIAAALAPAAVDNVLKFGAANSLTGPIARGDIETVSKEISALFTQCGEQFSDLYKALGTIALSLAVDSGKLSDSQRAAFTVFGLKELDKSESYY